MPLYFTRTTTSRPGSGGISKRLETEAQTKLRTWIGSSSRLMNTTGSFCLMPRALSGCPSLTRPEPVAPYLLQHASETLRSGQVAFLDFHRNAPDQPIRIAILVPILDRARSQQGNRASGPQDRSAEVSLSLYQQLAHAQPDRRDSDRPQGRK